MLPIEWELNMAARQATNLFCDKVYKIIQTNNLKIKEQSPKLNYPWIRERENMRLLQDVCLVAQSCLTLCDAMDCQHIRLLCPWDYPDKNAGASCHFFFQGIFPTQGRNPSLLQFLRWQVDSLPLSHLGSLRRESRIAAFCFIIFCLCFLFIIGVFGILFPGFLSSTFNIFEFCLSGFLVCMHLKA